MLRLCSLVFVLALSLTAAGGRAIAQTASAAAMQTVSGSGGYQYQVPGDWQTLPDYLKQRIGNQTLNIDGAVASSDGSQHAHVEAANGFGITTTNLNDFMNAFFSSPGGPGGAGPSAAVISGPESVQIAGADAAVSAAAQYTDPNGNPRVIAARVALVGQTTYLLALDMTQDFYQSNPGYAAIMNSFSLTPGSASAPATPAP